MLLLSSLVGLAPCTASALEFNFVPEPGTAPEAIEGFRAAGALWSAIFDDDITVNIDIGFRPLDPGVLAEAGSTDVELTYGQLRSGLQGDATSTEDRAAVGSLPSGTGLALLMNRTSNSPNGPGNARPFLDNDGDANNTTIRLNTASAKALGLVASHDPASDASITFSSDFRFDFDPSNGVDVDSFNFIFVAAHEIGHALGFVSGVDILDINSPNPPSPDCDSRGPFSDEQFTFVSAADVFRFSKESLAQGSGTIDWTADTRPKYFSTDSGATEAGTFSTGTCFGDGRQASHWEDDRGIGIMDPTAAPGEEGQITELDRRLFDTIGYNRQGVAAGPSALVAAAAAAAEPRFSFSRAAAAAPVLELGYSGGMIANRDPTPFVRVFGDGRVVVHYPRYMKKAGDYTTTLSQEELEDLLRPFAEGRLLTLDEPRLAAMAGGVRSTAGPTVSPSDHGVVANVQVRLERVRPEGAAAPLTNVDRRISVPTSTLRAAVRTPALAAAARAEVEPLSDLAAGVRQLEALAERPGLAKIQ
jgi:hypothetical protein